MAQFLFFDESGDFNFSPQGSHYYFFGALVTRDPARLNIALTRLRYQLLAEGLELERFHCSEDRQQVRNQVFAAIREFGDFHYHTLIIDKRRVNPAQYDPVRFYPEFARFLLDHIFYRQEPSDERVVIVTDTIPVKRRSQAVEKAFKTFLRGHFGDRPFTIVHQSSCSHPGLQAVDYCTWAMYRRWQNGDSRSFRLIEEFVRTEKNLLLGVTKRYY